MKKNLFLLLAALMTISGIYAHNIDNPTKKKIRSAITVATRRTPHVGDIVYPSAYSGGVCGWQDGDGQPWPVNPYSRSQDWVGQTCKITAVYTYCVVITPVWPIVPGSYYIQWDINHI